MTTDEAIELARGFARGTGRDADGYDAQAAGKGGDWQVDFYPRNRKAGPGEFFSVHFNETTPSAMRLVPGK